MSIITDLVTGVAGGLGDAAVKIREAITGVDPATAGKLKQIAAEADAAAQKAQTDLMQAQIDVNKQEAANQNIFVSGWRPFVGWICGCALGFNYLLLPLANWVIHFANIMYNGQLIVLPIIDITTMMPVLLGMLGLTAARTVEKIQGAQGNH